MKQVATQQEPLQLHGLQVPNAGGVQMVDVTVQLFRDEIQALREEARASREKLQSMNEELQTINSELQTKLDDLALAQSDMQNVLNSTEIAILFLDQKLNVRRYTDRAAKIISLRESDVGGARWRFQKKRFPPVTTAGSRCGSCHIAGWIT